MEHHTGTRGGTAKASTFQNLEIVQDHCLSQVVNIHTREDKTLGLLLTNSPPTVNRVKRMPLIDKADHDTVYIEYDIKAQAPRKINLYKEANMDGLRDHLAHLKDSFLSSDHSHSSVKGALDSAVPSAPSNVPGIK